MESPAGLAWLLQEKDLLGKAERLRLELELELEGDVAASLGRNGVERLKGKRVLDGEPLLADPELLASFAEEEEMVLRAELEQAMVARRRLERWVDEERVWFGAREAGDGRGSARCYTDGWRERLGASKSEERLNF